MRKFPYWTIGKIIRILREDGLESMNRSTFYNREEKGLLPVKDIHRTSSGWRTPNNMDAIEIMVFFWKDFFGEVAAIEYRKQLEHRYLNQGNK